MKKERTELMSAIFIITFVFVVFFGALMIKEVNGLEPIIVKAAGSELTRTQEESMELYFDDMIPHDLWFYDTFYSIEKLNAAEYKVTSTYRAVDTSSEVTQYAYDNTMTSIFIVNPLGMGYTVIDQFIDYSHNEYTPLLIPEPM